MTRQKLPVILLVAALAGCGSNAESRESDCKATLEGVRAAIERFYRDRGAVDNYPRPPTLAELTAMGLDGSPIPPNPYNGDERVAKATLADATVRRRVGAGHGWAYYDGAEGEPPPDSFTIGGAVFYCNSATPSIHENAW